jgi:hypothetical protein
MHNVYTQSLHAPLFSPDQQITIGAGFHNVGSGVLRASNAAMMKKVELHYGERCGHLPLDAQQLRVVVNEHTDDIHTQMLYLSSLFAKTLRAVTIDELRTEILDASDSSVLVVPYINVPETDAYIWDELSVATWGLPATMTHVLKNKATFYQLVDELAIANFHTPDYTISHLNHVATDGLRFLATIEDIYKTTGMQQYPLGLMLRAAESDGNYGCCLLYEQDGQIALIPDGDPTYLQHYSRWSEALLVAQQSLAATMNPQRETRVVMSRYIDALDSPGMSVVILDDQVMSLGWNSQLQKDGSKACIGTSTYIPKNADMQRLQQQYQQETASYVETLLRKTAEKRGISFGSIRGVTNLDTLIPTAMERELQKRRKQPLENYLAECNPRWTNYTDAIMTVLGVNRREQTVHSMRSTIEQGIATIDKYALPPGVDPREVRSRISEMDAWLQQHGTRIICRMTKNPLGVIFAGDIQQAQQELDAIVATLAHHQ